MSMDKKGLDKRVTIVATVAAAALVLLGAYANPSVYAGTVHFTSDFETSGIPLCSTEEVAFSGTQHVVFQEVNGRQTAHVNYQNVKGEGIHTGTQYTWHENDHFIAVTDDNGDIKFTTAQMGSAISSGSGDNTKVTIKLVTVVHPNGDFDTIVDDVEVKCPG